MKLPTPHASPVVDHDNSRNVATIDKRPFFEKALSFGVQNRILDGAICDAIVSDGAKGSIQVADHFGTSHLYADLENARKRIVHLVSLYLEDSHGADLEKAAHSLRDNSFLFHSRNGNDLLKKLHAMPESTIYGDGAGQSLKDFQDERTLTKPFSLSAYRKELLRRQNIATTNATALWFADRMEVTRASLDFIALESVIRTAILVRLSGAEKCPNRSEFAQLIETLRSKPRARGKLQTPKSILDDVPDAYRGIADDIRRDIEKHDIPLMSNGANALDALLNTFESSYFVRESDLDDVDNFDALVSKQWHKVTQGKTDPYSRLTLFMCLASGAKPKTAVTEIEARAMLRKVRKDGFDGAAVTAFIKQSAPFEIKENLLSLWEEEFYPDAQERLLDDSDTKCIRALRFLKENCNIKEKSAEKKKV